MAETNVNKGNVIDLIPPG